MNIFKRVREYLKKKEQKKRERQRVREIAMLLCQKKDYYDPEDQKRLLVDLDDLGIGFPGGF